jgi:uncharacterized membrane protein
MWVLLGVGVVIAGFILRMNPLLVIGAAAATTGILAGLSPFEVVAAFGKAFKENRFITAVWVVLLLIGVLEREGLQVRARQIIGAIKAATAGRVMLIYLVLRQITSALGLTALGGHPQMVRPLIAPMTEGAAEVQTEGALTDNQREDLKAMVAATDNVGLFFGEDIFIAIGSILLMVGFLANEGIIVDPLALAVWAIPTAICAFLVHGLRLLWVDKKLAHKPEPDTKAEAKS